MYFESFVSYLRLFNKIWFYNHQNFDYFLKKMLKYLHYNNLLYKSFLCSFLNKTNSFLKV